MKKHLLSIALLVCLVLTQYLYVCGSGSVGENGEVETPEMDLTEENPEIVDPPDSPGEVHAPGWHMEEGEWYYYEIDGTKRTDGWAKDSVGWCWMDGSGRITKNRWIIDGNEWYFLKASGYMAANEWARDSVGWCWMDGSGRITKNRWIIDGNEWYFLKASGYMAANEWARDSGGWYWMNGSGRITKSKWILTGGKWYYLGANGYMVTGTQKIGGKTYRFNASGVWIN